MRSPPSLLAALLLVAAQRAVAADTLYAVSAAQSSVVIHVGKAGLFGFAGHEHLVTAPRLQGEVRAADELSGSLVTLRFDTAALRVEEKGEPAGDAAKVQEVMVGPRVLDATRFPTVAFSSTAVTGRVAAFGAYDLDVTGQLSLHGVTRSVSLPLRVETRGDTLTATGRMVLRQTDYGMTPVSVAGVVKVKDELRIDYVVVAARVTP